MVLSAFSLRNSISPDLSVSTSTVVVSSMNYCKIMTQSDTGQQQLILLSLVLMFTFSLNDSHSASKAKD